MPITYLNDAIQETIFLEPVTLEEIRAIVSSLKNNATGFDEINAEYLKMSMVFVANPLVYICNMSFSEGVFPTQLKIANFVPLYKCDDPMLFNHYRPVSLLCTLSKVFEKVMYDMLIKFLEKISILYEYQFGFRRKRYTHFALITLIDKLTQAIENGEYVIGVFLDFSKAFDTVNHEILKGLITVWRELQQQHPSDLLSGAGTFLCSLDVPAPDNKSFGCCCRNSLPTVINPNHNMTKQRYITRFYDKMHSKITTKSSDFAYLPPLWLHASLLNDGSCSFTHPVANGRSAQGTSPGT